MAARPDVPAHGIGRDGQWAFAQTIYQCRACQHQATLISGTLLQDTKLPLTTGFLAIHLLTSTKTNLAALELKCHLGVSYRTAWRLKHKIMQAMAA